MKGKKWMLLALGALLYAAGWMYCQRAQEDLNLAQLVLRRNVSSEDVIRISRQEAEGERPLRFCFWGDGGEKSVSCPLNGKTRNVTAIYLAGNPELMGAGPLGWQAGCFIDEGTAQDLFGTARCGGQILRYQGKGYPVRGTLPGSLPRVIFMAQPENGTVLSRCVLDLPPQEARAQGEGFLLRHGLEGKVLDYEPFQALMSNLRLFFPGLLLAAFWRKRKREELTLSGILSGQQLTALARTVLSFAFLAAGLWLLGRFLVIPSRMLPSRWSDFSFWGSWWEDQKENFVTILSTAPSSEQLLLAGNMVKSIGSTTAAALLAAWAVRRENHADTADRG